ncbi:MAG: PEGA domain-containing protein [Gammaproteobacteria bacterium]|nr:PEGA domain-containing protein [Gammaproteobacteria bacterium]MDH5800371.1 PEGA domain-containing protein [Gammaproteobacteria bacterium]
MGQFKYIFATAFLLLLVVGCSESPVDIQLQVNAEFNGAAVSGAIVNVDGVAVGQTDANGSLNTAIAKLNQQVVKVSVVKDADGIKTNVWDGEFKVEKKENEEKLSQVLDVRLQNYVTVVVAAKDIPLSEVVVKNGNETIGTTDANGRLAYAFDFWPKKGLRLQVDKKGYAAKTVSYKGNSGDAVEVNLYERAVIRFSANADQSGTVKPIEGASVYLGKRLLGKTGGDGYFTYRHKGKHGGKIKFTLVARGYIPSSWSKSVVMDGKKTYERTFYSETPTRIKTGIYSVVSNTSGEDISTVTNRVKKQLQERFFKESKAFEEVPETQLVKLVRNSKLSMEKLKSKGWEKNRLARNLDLLVLGSVSRSPNNDYVIEVNFHRKDGQLVMSHVATSGSDSNWRIGRAVGEIVETVLERYPFEGMVTAVDKDNYRINLGDDLFPLSRNDIFEIRSVKSDAAGRVVKTVAIGSTEVDSARSKYTTLETIKKKVKVGDRVVRIDSPSGKEGEFVQLNIKGGVDADTRPLPGVNVYAEEKWVGITNRSGTIKIPARVGRDLDLVLYKHGYKQIMKSVEPESNNQNYEFVMQSYSSMLTVASQPAGAKVFLDDEQIGVTPMNKPYNVTLGFHTVRLQLGGDYRDWEEVIEFNKSEENRTGSNKITLYKDFVTIAEKAHAGGKIDAAVEAYKQTNSMHPDYAEARHRLAQIYLDDKQDYDAAIREFENVQELPEVKDLVLKQYAVVYTNLGHAYYAKGDSILDVDKKSAAQYFAKAIKALNTAKENTRFFPNESYDEVLHDTYYYSAIAFHNLYKLTGKSALQDSADLAWQQYFDFFPVGLETNQEYMKIKATAQRLWNELKVDA